MAGVLGEDVLKRIKALRKKLSQIEKLKARGGQYTEEEATKIKGESKILAEIQALEKGEEVAAFDEAGGQEEAPPEAKPDPEDGEADVSASKEPDLAPAEAEKRIRGLKKKLGQIQKLKERGGGYSKEESEKVSSEPSLLAECTELEIKLLEPEARKTARNLQKKLDQISKLRAKGGQLTPQEREKVGKEASLKKEFAELLAARVPVKEPAAQVEQSPTPDAKAAPKAQAVAQKQAPVAEVKPQPQQPQPVQYKPAAQSIPPSAQAPTYMGPPPSVTASQGVASVEDEAHVEDDAHVAAALAQAFAQEEFLEEEGFHESRASTRKRAIQAKAQARAEAARLQQEQLAAERAQQEHEAALLAERARQEQDRRFEERQLAAQRAQQEERLAAAQPEHEVLLVETAEVAEEEDAEFGPQAEEIQVEEPAEAPDVEVLPQAPCAVEIMADSVVPQVATPVEPISAADVALEAALDPALAPEKPAPEKRLRALRKKATQIEKLKQRGGEYTPEETEKLASEDSVLAEIAALEKGDPWPPVVEAAPELAPVVQQEEVLPIEMAETPPPAAPPLEVSSMDPVDAQKRLKALKKKLGQIEKLKERSGPFSPEEATKIASQQHVLADIKKLEEYLA
mmetsp:Transcript_57840/g.134731  ORF Transcript_57840/g.134731 Transcript_57840/m.134731 type:complete len:627 (+) Transcript_57840:89-1969(+)|eukprot:CAMPEP_0171076482 /NCGR_PEP_ID=MMETSP0766_2-20121228/13434_1 /TAXON_ID=439317 /ORGANISM="Gambierdiscus australes, Strain CAWD 149" /LENGTH=626 /DNA_ID=CAMNT_0011533461 /DNA_START=84 /DNA_END=1964 /DNA_ORIENTATION=+